MEPKPNTKCPMMVHENKIINEDNFDFLDRDKPEEPWNLIPDRTSKSNKSDFHGRSPR